MITDDQVATLLRDAGSAGPLPLPLDPSVAVARARKDRTRSQALVGLAAAAAVVAFATTQSNSWLDRATGSGVAPDSGAAWLPLVGLATKPVALILLAFGTPFGRRRPVGSGVRTALGAAWGVLVMTLLSLPLEVSVLVSSPHLIGSLRGQAKLVVTVMILVPLVLGGLGLLGRRILHPSSPRPWTGAFAMVLAALTGSAIVRFALHSAYMPSGVIEPAGLLLTVALGGLAVLSARAGVRGSDRPWPRALGTSLLVAAATSTATALPPLLTIATGGSASAAAGLFALVAAASAAAAISGTWLALGVCPRRLRIATLAAVAAVVALAAGLRLDDMFWSGSASGRLSLLSIVTGLVLAAIATAALSAVDRRTAVPTSPPAET